MADELRQKYLTLISWADWCAYADELNADLAAARARCAELEAANRWIPAGERMPDHGEWVVAWNGNTEGSLACYRYDKWFYLGSAPRIMEWEINLPTHWRPLPEPPEAKDADR